MNNHFLSALFSAAMTFTIFTIFTTFANPTMASTPDWCRLDDPAAYEKLRREAVEGRRDLSGLECEAPTYAEGGLPKELVLPMPCGRHITFRRIDVPVEHVLDQIEGNFGRQVDASREPGQVVASSGAWRAPISGGFTVSKTALGSSDAVASPSFRSYYIGKYEITEPQALLWRMGLLEPGRAGSEATDAECAAYTRAVEAMDQRRVLAAGGFSWYDGIVISRDLTAWALALDRDRIAKGLTPFMPWEQGATGVVRMPTESEWEYAARGGSVEIESRSVTLPLIRDSSTGATREPVLDEICAATPPEGDLGFVGLKEANLFGLHDILCNAEEIVLDLFRPTRPDGLQGHSGGFTTKGGSSKFERARNTVGMRFESPLYSLDGETRRTTIGLRLALNAPVFVGRRDRGAAFVENIQNEPLNQALSASREALLQSGIGFAQDERMILGEQLDSLRERLQAQEVDRGTLQEQVEVLQQQLYRLNTQLNERARDAARQSIRAGVVAGNLIDRVGRNMFFAMDRRKKLDAEGHRDMSVDFWKPEVEKNSRRIATTFELYLRTHSELATAPEDFVRRQLAATGDALDGFSLEVFGTYFSLFLQHHNEVREANGAVTEEMRARWLYQLDAQRALREATFPEFN